jgi:uncharacterized membrane protein YfhO
MNSQNHSGPASTAGKFLFSLLMLLMTLAGTIAMLKLFHYAPFGTSSLASMDADIQYLDFFAYLKDCAAGKNSIFYSMSTHLGQSNFTLFAYYLASPVNLLLFFFDKDHLQDYFDIAVAVKLSLSAFTMSWYLQSRFEGRLKKILTAILTLSYAWMNYSFMQSSNIMWLDGLYMMPLIMLGAWKILKGGKTHCLTLPVGLAILFNWYAAGMICLFSILWFAFEALLLLTEGKIGPGSMIAKTLKYIWAMALGVLLSGVFFLPTVYLFLSQGTGQGDPRLFQDLYYNNFISMIQGFAIGSSSNLGRVVLFCGTLALLGALSFFFSDRIPGAHKILAAGLFLFLTMAFFWNPLTAVFSLFKRVDSYWYRYAFLGSFTVIFLAALFFDRAGDDEKTPGLLTRTAAGFILLLGFAQYANGKPELKMLFMTMIFTFLTASGAYVMFRMEKHRWAALLAGLFCLVLTMGELVYNAKVQMYNYRKENADEYAEFMDILVRQTGAVKEADDGIYRISQTGGRAENYDHIQNTYNDMMAAGVWSIVGYTSNSHLETLRFLDRMGYRNMEDRMSIVNTSILPVDSLLGVKYIISAYPVAGLEEAPEFGTEVYQDDESGEELVRKVYRNPYALPMALVWQGEEEDAEEAAVNSFEYVNQVYSDLMGEETLLFRPLDYETDREDPLLVSYDVSGIPAGAPVYGNLVSPVYLHARLTVGEAYYANYSMWLSPTVFYIPSDQDHIRISFQAEIYSGDTEVDVLPEAAETFLTDKEIEDAKATATGLMAPVDRAVDAIEPQFYYLDLETMERVSSLLAQREPEAWTIENGKITADVKAEDGDSLLVSVPMDRGWKITVNGSAREAEAFAGALVSIPLDDGDNHVEMTYEVPYLKLGALSTLTGILLLVLTGIAGVLTGRKKKESFPALIENEGESARN